MYCYPLCNLRMTSLGWIDPGPVAAAAVLIRQRAAPIPAHSKGELRSRELAELASR